MTSTTTPRTLLLRDLVLTDEIGDGGEGTVHDLQTTRGVPAGAVLKRYQRTLSPARADQLEALVQLRAQLRLGMAPYAWPEATVLDDGLLVGVLMPRAPDPFWVEVTLRSGGRQQRLREVQYLLFPAEKLARLGIAFATLPERLELLAALSAAVGRLHDLGLVYGDLSARNVLYATDGPVGVFLLDCDGIVEEGARYVVDSPDWTDPAAPEVAMRATDVHKLGLLAARVLAVDPTTRTLPGGGGTPAVLRDVLTAALDPSPAARPDMLELQQALGRCAPGPADSGADLPRWALRPPAGELVLLSIPEPPRPGEGDDGRGSRPGRFGRRGVRSRRGRS